VPLPPAPVVVCWNLSARNFKGYVRPPQRLSRHKYNVETAFWTDAPDSEKRTFAAPHSKGEEAIRRFGAAEALLGGSPAESGAADASGASAAASDGGGQAEGRVGAAETPLAQALWTGGSAQPHQKEQYEKFAQSLGEVRLLTPLPLLTHAVHAHTKQLAEAAVPADDARGARAHEPARPGSALLLKPLSSGAGGASGASGASGVAAGLKDGAGGRTVPQLVHTTKGGLRVYNVRSMKQLSRCQHALSHGHAVLDVDRFAYHGREEMRAGGFPPVLIGVNARSRPRTAIGANGKARLDDDLDDSQACDDDDVSDFSPGDGAAAVSPDDGIFPQACELLPTCNKLPRGDNPALPQGLREYIKGTVLLGSTDDADQNGAARSCTEAEAEAEAHARMEWYRIQDVLWVLEPMYLKKHLVEQHGGLAKLTRDRRFQAQLKLAKYYNAQVRMSQCGCSAQTAA
jgi:hypothetical protein